MPMAMDGAMEILWQWMRALSCDHPDTGHWPGQGTAQLPTVVVQHCPTLAERGHNLNVSHNRRQLTVH